MRERHFKRISVLFPRGSSGLLAKLSADNVGRECTGGYTVKLVAEHGGIKKDVYS